MSALFICQMCSSPRAAAWLKPESLPTEPAGAWPVVCATHGLQSPVPILFGEPDHEGYPSDPQNGQMHLPIDILGSVFFLLSRYEEVVSKAGDRRDRFAGTGSFSHRFGLLERPLANEYLEILWTSLQRRWPGLERRAEPMRGTQLRRGRTIFRGRPALAARMALSLAADLVKRRAPDLAWRRLRAKSAGGGAGIRHDPNNTFNFMMTTGERHGLKTTFFLKAGVSEPQFDEAYSLEAAPVALCSAKSMPAATSSACIPAITPIATVLG